MASGSMPGFGEAIGYRIFYRHDAGTVCPCCHKSQWLVGRMTAECAFCATALPIEGGGRIGAGLFRTRGGDGAHCMPDAA